MAVAADGRRLRYRRDRRLQDSWPNLLLRKYAANGALLWMKTYNGVRKRLGSKGRGVAVAADGGVYVTGLTEVAGESWNLLLRKYAPNGALLWKKDSTTD